MASRVEELFIELQLKTGEFALEAAKVKRELEALGTKAGAGAGNNNALGDSFDRLGNKSAAGLAKASNAITNMAGASLGATNKVGNLVEGLLLGFGVGGTTLAAVSAGILGVTLLIRALGEDLDETDRAIDEILTKKGQAALTENLDRDPAKQRARLAEQEKEVTRLGALLASAKAEAEQLTGVIEADAAAIDRLSSAQSRFNDGLVTLIDLSRGYGRTLEEVHEREDRATKDKERKADAATRAAEQEQNAIDGVLRKAEDALADTGQGLAEAALLGLAREEQEFTDFLAANFDKLTTDMRNKVLAAIDVIASQRGTLQRAIAEVLDAVPTPVNVLTPGIRAREVRVPPLQLKTNADLLKLYEAQRQKLLQQTQLIEDALRGALQMADAFGAVDENTRRSLDGLLSMATTLPKLIQEVKLLGTPGQSIEGVVSGAIGVLGGITSLVSGLLGGGESPEEKALREALAKNVEALDKLRREVGNIDVNITGTRFGQLQQFASTVTGGSFPLVDNLPGGLGNRIDRELRDLRLTRDDLKEAAAELGLEFRNSAEFYRQFAEALKAAEITRFAESFLGAVQAMNAELALFDLDQPIEELQALQKVASGKVGAPALGALAGIDLTTAEGRAAAETLIQELFRQMQAGTLDPSALGGLLPREFLELLLQLEALIDSVNAEGRQGGQTVGEAISRSITETSAGTVISVLTTGNVYAQETARNTALTVEELRTLRQQLAGAGSGPVVEGAALRSIEQVDRELGVRVRRRQRELGRLVA